ncbi:hypothetical protein [Streptomyces sp. NRRL WC-3742]|uniref:hypothetical protein n=1 Tax=Streptomyces sp. NRRL WC-3742 TaxID=1463934 RepID=UPI0004C8D072|nr:hypothetical protein [Streptomyces sp. NRRL WC-3742]
MFRASAPVRPAAPGGPDDNAAAPALPRLVRGAAYAPDGTGAPYDPASAPEGYYRELAEPYGVPFDREQFAASPRRTSVELAYGALDALGPIAEDEAPQLVVIAYAAPDFEHTELVASCVRRRLPGDPLAFAVSDQGALAPYTALRAGVEYARRCGWTRLLLLAVDQGSQPFALPEPSDGAAVRGDAAVALLLHWDGGRSPLGGQAQGRPGAGPLPAWPAEPFGVVAGAGLSDAPVELPVHSQVLTTVEGGLPATGSWSALLGLGPQDGPVVLADYDRERDFLAHCTLFTRELRRP